MCLAAFLPAASGLSSAYRWGQAFLYMHSDNSDGESETRPLSAVYRILPNADDAPLWFGKPEAINPWKHASRNAPWQAETSWGEKVKPRKPAWNQAFLWLSICGCQVRNKNFCKKISLSEPKPIRFQTQKGFSCYFSIWAFLSFLTCDSICAII